MASVGFIAGSPGLAVGYGCVACHYRKGLIEVQRCGRVIAKNVPGL